MPGADLGSSARRWLSPVPASPWRFDDAGDALVWRDGETVAFRAEVGDALRRVARNLEIVPPFPAVALLLAAARAEGRQISTEHWDLVRDAMEAAAPWLFARVAAVREVAETASALRMLEHVPAEVFARPDALAFLAEAVFEGSGIRRDAKEAAGFLLDLDAEPTPGTAVAEEDARRRQAAEWGEGLAALRLGLGRLDPATLARRARTGIDRDVVPAELAWPDALQVRGFLAALRDDPDVGAIARLANDVMAAIRLPRPGATPEDLPIGGYADLANRGSPERLLVSELAHDGLTLAVRIALREALYLRRESPPRAPHGTRCILLDAGIRLWGVGRVFATSVGLALGATSERGVSVRAWRACGRSVERVDLGSRADLDVHLQALHPQAHPGGAIAPFLAECASLKTGVECCVVTHAKSLDEPELRDALRAAGRIVHVVTVTATGDLALHVFNAAGSQVLRTARLDLADLLAGASGTSGRRSPLALRDPARDDAQLPAILRLDRLPLRIPHSPGGSAYREAPGRGVVARTQDRRLVLWTGAHVGPIEVSDHTPPGAVRDFRVIDDVVHIVCAGGQGVPTTWMRADLTEPIVETHVLPSVGATPSAAFVFGESGSEIGLVSGRWLHVVHADDPSVAARQLPLPTGARHARGRLFHRASTGDWWVVARDATPTAFEPVSIPRADALNVATVFERPGRDGPWALLRKPFRLLDTSRGVVIPMPSMPEPDFDFLSVGSAGNRVVFASRKSGRAVLYEIGAEPSRIQPLFGKFERLPEPMVAQLHVANVRRRLAQVGRHVDVDLAIDDLGLRTAPSGELQMLPMLPGLARTRLVDMHSFTARRRLPGRHWHLDEAAWADGSRALLDSRGMVHLVSSDTSAPEVTIVFAGGCFGAWSSDGAMHGDRYFLGDAPSVPGAEMLRRIRRFTERLR